MKKAFTLAEIIISIFIFSLIMIFLYKSTSNLKLNNTNLKKNYEKKKKIYKTIYQLKNDLILSENIKIYNDKNKLELITYNTLYQNSKPKVIWIMLKNSKKLIRIENEKVDFTIIINSIKFYQNKNKDKIVCYIKDYSRKDIVFEVLTKQQKTKKGERQRPTFPLQ